LGASSLWSKQTLRPRGNSELVFLADALEEAAGRLIGDAWSGAEPSDAMRGPPPVTEAVGRFYRERWSDSNEQNEHCGSKYEFTSPEMVESWERLLSVMTWIATEGAEKNGLETNGRKVVGGDYFELPRSIWNIEELWFNRFQACQVVHDGEPTYIFITRESLNRALKKATRYSGTNAGAHPSSLAQDDAPLVEEMRALIESGEATGAYSAALAVTDRAKGGGSSDSKTRRLERRYSKRFGK
jgi:hypothetical protein